MATTVTMSAIHTGSDVDRILRPRPTRPLPEALRANGNGNLQVMTEEVNGFSSGRSTPVPEHAPPSAHSISSARKAAREKMRKRLFHTISYEPRVSHFDPQSEYKDFKGFFVLFWIGLTIMVMTSFLKNIRETGHPLRIQVYKLLSRNVVSLGIVDSLMVGSTAICLPMQHVFRNSKGFLQWRKGGIWIQSIYQIAWLFLWVELPFVLQWTWTAQVYFALHTLTFLMKMHSYAFYNGHLGETARRLHALDRPEKMPNLARAVKYPASPSRLRQVESISDEENEASIAEEKEKLKIQQLRIDLATELTSPLGQVTFPQNLTVGNFADYVLCPTLCYELEYPRMERIRWLEVFWKALAVFGCIFLMTIVSEEFITPVLGDAAIRLRHQTKMFDQGLILAESMSLLLFPFMIMFLLVFLVIWEYALGAFAELTRFADRRFYSDWWNCEDWLEFSREWNIPVHHFLRRHVYFSTRYYSSNSVAMLMTFLVSSLGHELIMGCITKKLRGYGFVAMMLQLPIVAIQRSPLVKGRWIFNNAVFWSSMILGLSAMCSLYVLV